MNYSKWDHIEVSDDDEEAGKTPNIEKASLFRYRHQDRIQRAVDRKLLRKQLIRQKQQLIHEIDLLMQQEQQEQEQEQQNQHQSETQQQPDNPQSQQDNNKCGEASENSEDVRKPPEVTKKSEAVQALKKLELDKINEQLTNLWKAEQREAWNVDSLSTKEGFNSSRINSTANNNKASKDEAKVAKAGDLLVNIEGKEMRISGNDIERMGEFVNGNRDDARTFAALPPLDRLKSRQFLLDHPALCSDEAVGFLHNVCLEDRMRQIKAAEQGRTDDRHVDEGDAEVGGGASSIANDHHVVNNVPFQTVLLQYLLDTAKQMNRSPRDPQFITQFYQSLDDVQLLKMIDEDVTELTERVNNRANTKLMAARQESVLAQLSPEVREAFLQKDMNKLTKAASELAEDEFNQIMDKCISVGLWLPSPSEGQKAGHEMTENK